MRLRKRPSDELLAELDKDASKVAEQILSNANDSGEIAGSMAVRPRRRIRLIMGILEERGEEELDTRYIQTVSRLLREEGFFVFIVRG